MLEVVVAMLIFSTVTIAFLGAWSYHVRASEKSRHYLVASFLAESLIEKAISQGYNGLEVKPEEGEARMKITARGTETEVVYKTFQNVTEIGDLSVDRLKSVVVVVTWEDSNKTGEVRLETVVAGAG